MQRSKSFCGGILAQIAVYLFLSIAKIVNSLQFIIIFIIYLFLMRFYVYVHFQASSS